MSQPKNNLYKRRANDAQPMAKKQHPQILAYARHQPGGPHTETEPSRSQVVHIPSSLSGDSAIDEFLLGQAFELSPIAMSIGRLNDGAILRANRANHQFFENARGDYGNRTARDFYADKSDRDVFTKQLKLAGGVTDFETIMITDRGNLRNTLISANVFEENGQQYVLSAFHDITAQKNRTAAIHAESNSIKLLHTITSAANKATSVEEAVQVCLNQVCRHHGWPIGHAWLVNNETQTLHSLKVWHCDDRPRFAEIVQLSETIPYPVGLGPGEAVETKTTFNNSDLASYRKTPRADAISAAGLTACTASPVLVDSEVVAVLEFLHNDPGAAQHAVMDLLTQIGTQIGRIFERKRAEDALHEKDVFYRKLVDDLDVFVWEGIHRELSFTFVSAAAERILGYPVERWYEKDFFINHLHPEDREETIAFFLDQSPKESDEKDFVYRMIAADGSEVWLQDFAQNSPDGTIARGITVDVTPRMTAERELANSHQRYKELIDDVHAIVWELDIASMCFTFVSKSAPKILGYPIESWYEKDFWEQHIHPQDREETVATCIEQTKQVLDHEFDYRMIAADGSIVWLHDVVHVVTDKSGDPWLLRGVMYDITERKTAEVALEQSEQRFQALYHHAPAMFILVDEKQTIQSLNHYSERQLGYKKEELIGRKFTEIIMQEDLHKTEKQLASCLQNNQTVATWELRQLHKMGHTIWVRAAARSIEDSGRQRLLITGEDITENRRLSDQLGYQATHDSLTGLVNRQEFERRLHKLLQSGSDGKCHALCYLDLDQFKIINDSCGHLAGDELLRQLASQLGARVRKTDTLARLGGDEFGVLMEQCSVELANDVAEQLRDLVRTFQFVWDGKRFSLGVSIGLVPINETSGTLKEVLSAADVACYAAKDGGRNQVHLFHPMDKDLSARRGEMNWVTRLDHAIAEDRLMLYMQPIMALSEKNCGDGDHYELLLRMVDEQGGIIPPGAFLPAAERYNMASKVDEWVVNRVFSWFSTNPSLLKQLGQLNINLSGHSVSNPSFIRFLSDQLDTGIVPASRICFEITETAAIHNLSATVEFLNELKQKGCKFALDDFGSGLSSFSYLKNLPVDYLKIDGSFVKDMMSDKIDAAMVKSINDIGHVMGKRTVAEFVENREIIEALRELGVDYAQGYGVGRPLPFITLPRK